MWILAYFQKGKFSMESLWKCSFSKISSPFIYLRLSVSISCFSADRRHFDNPVYAYQGVPPTSTSLNNTGTKHIYNDLGMKSNLTKAKLGDEDSETYACAEKGMLSHSWIACIEFELTLSGFYFLTVIDWSLSQAGIFLVCQWKF